MRWRSDIAAMLRARWRVLAVWTVLLAAMVTTMLATGWWSAPQDATVRPVEVRSAATQALQEELEFVSAERPWTFIATERSPDRSDDGVPDVSTGSTLPIYDDGRGQLREALRTAERRCSTRPPYEIEVTGSGTFETDLSIRIEAAARSDLIDTGYSWEDDKRAPEGTTYVQLLVVAENGGDEASFPSLSIALVSERGQVYREVFESTMDYLGSAMAGEQIAGIVLFRVPSAIADSVALYALVTPNIYSTTQLAGAIETSSCVAIAPTRVATVGASDRVEDRRLVDQ